MISYRSGRYEGKMDSIAGISLWDVLKWKLTHPPLQRRAPHCSLSVVDMSKRLQEEDDCICWLGHASFFIRLGGKRILIDPVLGDIPFYKRDIPAPYSAEQIGDIDIVLLSHTHYDHFDKPTLRQFASRIKQAIVPMHMRGYLEKLLPHSDIMELVWYDIFETEGLRITLVPARHWGRRGLFDKNRALWGGFVIEYNGKCIYFAGDSAEGAHFAEIGNCFDIDIALLPIGAYRPAVIMKHNHLDPAQAYAAFEQLGAKRMIPMHYGTFKLSDEPLDEPLAWMQHIAQTSSAEIICLDTGEVMCL
jgi:L-ascorbate metabolism protein UlaG (beta-lactamase superfamily)